MLCWQHIPTMESGLYFTSSSAQELLSERSAGRHYGKQIKSWREFIVSLIKPQQRKCMSPSSIARGLTCETGGLERMSNEPTVGVLTVFWYFSQQHVHLIAMHSHLCTPYTHTGSRAYTNCLGCYPCPCESAYLNTNKLCLSAGLNLFTPSWLELHFLHAVFTS